jgi:hypothetical protein
MFLKLIESGNLKVKSRETTGITQILNYLPNFGPQLRNLISLVKDMHVQFLLQLIYWAELRGKTYMTHKVVAV